MTKFLFSKNQSGASVRTNASCPPVLGKEAAKYITAFEYRNTTEKFCACRKLRRGRMLPLEMSLKFQKVVVEHRHWAEIQVLWTH